MVVQTPMVIVVVVVMVVLVVLLLLLLLPPSLPLLPTSLPHLALVKRARLHELIHNRRDQSREACCRVPTTRSSWEPRQAHSSAAALQVVPVFFMASIIPTTCVDTAIKTYRVRRWNSLCLGKCKRNLAFRLGFRLLLPLLVVVFRTRMRNLTLAPGPQSLATRALESN